MTRQQWRAIGRAFAWTQDLPEVVPVSGRTRTTHEIRRRFHVSLGIFAGALLGLFGLVLAIGIAAVGMAEFGRLVGTVAAVIAGIGAFTALFAIPLLWAIYGAPARLAPDPPHELRATTEGLSIRFGDGTTCAGSWRDWFPVNVQTMMSKWGPTLTGIVVAPVNGDGRVPADRIMTITHPTTRQGNALVRACIAGLRRADRLTPPE